MENVSTCVHSLGCTAWCLYSSLLHVLTFQRGNRYELHLQIGKVRPEGPDGRDTVGFETRSTWFQNP